MKKAIIICSGGLDSVVTAHYVFKTLKYKKLKVLFFSYGQKSLSSERKAAKLCARKLNSEFYEINLKELGEMSNSLINKPGKIKTIKNKDLKDTSNESKKYYVPCRNTIFLIYALALAESEYVKNKSVNDIFVGFKCEGRESYPDTTKEFVMEMNKLAKIGCHKNFKIKAPLINKDKEDIILLGKKLDVKLEETFSCYVGKDKHCGKCLACKLRQAGFYWAGVPDKTRYLTS